MLWSVPIFFLHGLSKVSARNNYIVNMPTRWPASFSSSRQAGSTETVVVLLFLFLSPGSLCLFFLHHGQKTRKNSSSGKMPTCRPLRIFLEDAFQAHENMHCCQSSGDLSFPEKEKKNLWVAFYIDFPFPTVELAQLLVL